MIAAASPLPPLGRLFLGSLATLGRSPRGEAPTLDRTARFQAGPLSGAFLERYRAFFGGFASDVPLTALYPLAMRSQLALMLEGDFPYPAPGMIHVSNDLERLAPIEAALGFELTVALGPAPEAGRLAFEVTLAQAGQPRVRCTSLYQPRGVRVARGDRPRTGPIALPDDARRETWALPAHEGRAYARVSGDYNPIHLSPWTSRFFGFDRPIMHGMDAVGRALASLERGLERPVDAIAVSFKKPIPLPASPCFAWHAESAAQGRFVLEAAGEGVRHLEGGYRTELS